MRNLPPPEGRSLMPAPARKKRVTVQREMISLRLDPILLERLRRHCLDRGESRARIVRRAILALLDAEQAHPWVGR